MGALCNGQWAHQLYKHMSFDASAASSGDANEDLNAHCHIRFAVILMIICTIILLCLLLCLSLCTRYSQFSPQSYTHARNHTSKIVSFKLVFINLFLYPETTILIFIIIRAIRFDAIPIPWVFRRCGRRMLPFICCRLLLCVIGKWETDNTMKRTTQKKIHRISLSTYIST